MKSCAEGIANVIFYRRDALVQSCVEGIALEIFHVKVYIRASLLYSIALGMQMFTIEHHFYRGLHWISLQWSNGVFVRCLGPPSWAGGHFRLLLVRAHHLLHHQLSQAVAVVQALQEGLDAVRAAVDVRGGVVREQDLRRHGERVAVTRTP